MIWTLVLVMLSSAERLCVFIAFVCMEQLYVAFFKLAKICRV